MLYSKTLDQFYVGHSANLEDRIYRYTNSGSKSTKEANDWILVYKEEFPSRGDAYNREIEIKKKKSRNYIQQLISWLR